MIGKLRYTKSPVQQSSSKSRLPRKSSKGAIYMRGRRALSANLLCEVKDKVNEGYKMREALQQELKDLRQTYEDQKDAIIYYRNKILNTSLGQFIPGGGKAPGEPFTLSAIESVH